MRQKILTVKAWKLFVLTTVLPFAAVVITAVIQISLALKYQYTPPTGPFIALTVPLFLIVLAGSVIHYYWIWSVATHLQQYMHSDMRKLETGRFRLFFFIPLVYFVLLTALLPLFMVPSQQGARQSADMMAAWSLPMLCMHLFSAFCIIYTWYFTVKTLRSAEMQKEAHFSDYIGEFFMIWFFPVGIWFLQPRINALVNGAPPAISGSDSKLLDSTDF